MFESFLSKLHERLCKACENNDFETIKYLLGNKKIKANIDLTAYEGKALIIVCQKGKEEIFDYLLSFDEFSQPEDYSRHINFCFASACLNDNTNVAKFLFNNKKYGQHIQLYFEKGLFFKNAYKHGKEKVLEFLIMEAKVSRNNSHIQDILKNVNSPLNKKCEVFFSAQELDKELSLDCEDMTNKKKLKI